MMTKPIIAAIRFDLPQIKLAPVNKATAKVSMLSSRHGE